MMISAVDSVENRVGKGKNDGYQHFLLSHNVFKKWLIPQSRLKSGLYSKELNLAQAMKFVPD